MAEILIKGMALPKPSTYPITLSIYPNGNIYIHHELSAYKAIEVPPHGRLIDVDALPIKDEWSLVGTDVVWDAPTVLEATKERKK